MNVRKLGVVCDLESLSKDERSASFALAEFAEMSDGRRVLLHNDRGWSQRQSFYDEQRPLGDPPAVIFNPRVEDLLSTLRTTLLPDDRAEPDDHDWERLVDLLAGLGVVASRDELRGLPYEVEFSDALLAKFNPAEAAEAPFLIDWIL